MGIKPGSLYVAFGNKQELFRRALRRYLATEVSFIQDALNEPTAFGVVQRLLRESALFLSRPGFPRGCMTIQASQVITEEGAEVHKELLELRVRSQKQLRDRLSRAKREGDLPADSHPDSLTFRRCGLPRNDGAECEWSEPKRSSRSGGNLAVSVANAESSLKSPQRNGTASFPRADLWG